LAVVLPLSQFNGDTDWLNQCHLKKKEIIEGLYMLFPSYK
jgi:hypothetical protein